jgi:hypothetical protein
MSSFGSATFGDASFGGDPGTTTGLLLEMDAEITSTARRFVARSMTDGTSFKMIEFTVGQGGLDLFDYKYAIPVNQDAADLDDPLTLTWVNLPGTLSTTATDPTISTTEDLTPYLLPGYDVEVTTGSGTETLTVLSVTATEFVATTPATWTDAAATGRLETFITGAKKLTAWEYANAHSATAYCQLDNTEANERLSEVGIWAEILWSPHLTEIGHRFLAAVAHFPLVCKNDSMRYVFRVNVLI